MNTTIQLPPLPAPPKRNTAGGSIQEIESGLLAYFQRWLDRDDLQFECRFLFVGSNKPQGAFFDLTASGIANAAALVHSMDQRSDCRGCYATINPAKRNDKPRNKLLNQLTKDADILEEKCFHVLVDVDAAKPEGFTDFHATDRESESAQAAGKEILSILSLEANTVVHSGNGWQAVFPIAGITKSEHQSVLKRIAAKLELGGDPDLVGRVKVDSSVCNPARIWRIPFTRNRKGSANEERPAVVASTIIRPAIESDRLPDLIRDNQREVEAILEDIRQEEASKSSAIERSHAKATQKPTEPEPLKNGIITVRETGTSLFERACAYVRVLAEKAPAIASQGGHNATFAACCKIIQKFPKLSEDEQFSCLEIYNDLGCRPVWTRQELLHKLADARQAPALHKPFTDSNFSLSAAGKYELVEDCSDRGNAHRLLDRYGEDLRYVSTWKQFCIWQDSCWRLDINGVSKQWFKSSVEDSILVVGKWVDDHASFATLAKGEVETETHRLYRKYAALLKFLKQGRNVGKMSAGLESAQSEDITLEHSCLNQLKDVFVAANGTIDLKTGKLYPSRREDLLTQRSSYRFDPKASCPRWMKFLGEIFIKQDDGLPDQEMIDFIQRVFGCAITGRACEENLVVIFAGKGGNGKSKLIEAISHVVGEDLAYNADPSFLMSARASAHPTGLAALFGKRLVFAIEPSTGKMNTALVKSLSGNDSIAARRMGEDYWNFLPQCLLTISTNAKPAIPETSDGIWRRLRVVEFHRQFTEKERDQALGEKLRQEASGILNWLVAGAKSYLENGLQTPESVNAATSRYRADEDLVGRWIAECCEIHQDSTVRSRASAVQTSFREWCDRNGLRTERAALSEGLKRAGCAQIKNSTLWWSKIRLLEEGGDHGN